MSDAQATFEHTFSLPAPPDRVFAALTDPDELRAWFAEHVDIAAETGGRYRFWGRHTAGAPAAGDVDQSITAFEPGALLAYSWTWAGVATHVTLALEAADYRPWGAGDDVAAIPGSKLRVEHKVDGRLPFPRPEQLVDDHWRLATGNLFAHLEGKGNVVLPDYAADTAEVDLSIDIEAPVEAVFRALTEPECLNQWMAKAARVDLEVGGDWDLGWVSGEEGAACKILELDAPHRLVTSWPDWRGSKDVPDQRIAWTLESTASGTRVRLVHDGFVRAADRSDFQQGWPTFLEGLTKVAVAEAAKL